jgi:hypothetical protein
MKAVARAGRKRATNVVRFPGGQIVRSPETLIMPYNCDNVITIGDGKLGNKIRFQRQTVLEQLVLEVSQRMAGEAFAELRDKCRLYSWDAPPINPKVSSLESGHGHASGDLTEEELAKGKKYHRRYLDALGALQRGSRGVGAAIVAVCLENKMPTPDQRPKLREGLSILARHWGF